MPLQVQEALVGIGGLQHPHVASHTHTYRVIVLLAKAWKLIAVFIGKWLGKTLPTVPPRIHALYQAIFKQANAIYHAGTRAFSMKESGFSENTAYLYKILPTAAP